MLDCRHIFKSFNQNRFRTPVPVVFVMQVKSGDIFDIVDVKSEEIENVIEKRETNFLIEYDVLLLTVTSIAKFFGVH